MQRENPISLWDATAVEDDIESPFEPDGQYDVAIVGGGFTGLSTALHCAERGLSSHVLEARHVGYGGSGRNVGLVNAGVWLPPADVRAKLGKVYGPRFLDIFGRGPSTVFELIERHQIRCEATRNGTIHAAHSPRGYKELEGRHAEWQRLGEPVELLDRAQVAELVGTNVFHGGLLDHRAGTINPMAYCRGLSRAAISAGAKISTGVRVIKLLPEQCRWRIVTDKGSVTAKNVVLGTNAYTDDLWPGLKKVFTIIHYFQLATYPLGREADHILPGRQGLWDTGTIMSNFRRDDAGRLLIGSMGRIMGSSSRGLTHRWAARHVRRLFPKLGSQVFEEAWHGQIAMTPDHLPKIHQLAKGLWTTIGYNGRGITTGTIFGQSLADLLTGMDPINLPQPVTSVREVPRSAITSRVYDLAFSVNQLWKIL